MDLTLPSGLSFAALEKIIEYQRTVHLGKKRENKKRLMNNYLQSIQDSESVFSKEPKRVFSKRGSKSKQIVIEGTSSSFRTESLDDSDDE